MTESHPPAPIFEYDLRLTSYDPEGYYVTRWDRAKNITVRASTEREAFETAKKALGDPSSTGTWASRPRWTYRCDAMRQVTT